MRRQRDWGVSNSSSGKPRSRCCVSQCCTPGNQCKSSAGQRVQTSLPPMPPGTSPRRVDEQIARHHPGAEAGRGGRRRPGGAAASKFAPPRSSTVHARKMGWHHDRAGGGFLRGSERTCRPRLGTTTSRGNRDPRDGDAGATSHSRRLRRRTSCSTTPLHGRASRHRGRSGHGSWHPPYAAPVGFARSSHGAGTSTAAIRTCTPSLPLPSPRILWL